MQDRRKFLKGIFFSATTAAFGTVLLQGCGGNEPAKEKPAPEKTDKPAAAPEAQAPAIIDSSQMTQEDFDKRKNLGYVEKTPMEDNRCENCALYLQPEGENKKYGGCQLLRGPIAPDGYCPYWAAKQG
ncbi:high-potential iron-sulfur protein [Niabella pedocola]|uniref:High-potential iron-sulfur protein n=1 Tax=Niabella pedocola TaxID=1752077 RepID=A0ABS8PMZ4_9BACT|nr:high-potential iron-sulfur protein [Niabella pedocola]MCD2422489.1 high-potential iron-sulfur protein [Niabella pedocola]